MTAVRSRIAGRLTATAAQRTTVAIHRAVATRVLQIIIINHGQHVGEGTAESHKGVAAGQTTAKMEMGDAADFHRIFDAGTVAVRLFQTAGDRPLGQCAGQRTTDMVEVIVAGQMTAEMVEGIVAGGLITAAGRRTVAER